MDNAHHLGGRATGGRPFCGTSPGGDCREGSRATVGEGHELIYLDGDRVLDWETASGNYRVWTCARG